MSNPNAVVFDPAAFRAQFKAFSNQTCYGNAALQSWFDMATTFIEDVNNACSLLGGAPRVQALNFLVAHLIQFFNQAADGETPGVLVSASIDKVRVEVEPPPKGTQFDYWLNTTPYGSALAALLTLSAAGGIYVGGLPERDAFRRVYGGFNGPWSPNDGGCY